MAFGEHNIASLQALMEAFRNAGMMQSDRLNRRQQAIGGLNQNIWGANQTIFDLLKQKKESEEKGKERGFLAGESLEERMARAEENRKTREATVSENKKQRWTDLLKTAREIKSREKVAGMTAGRELGDRQSDILDIAMGLVKASYPGAMTLWDDPDWRIKNKDGLIKAFRDTIRTFSVTPNEEASLIQAFDSLFGGEKEKISFEPIPLEGGGYSPLLANEIPERTEQVQMAAELRKGTGERRAILDTGHKLFEMLNALEKLKKQDPRGKYQTLYNEVQKVKEKPDKTADDIARINQLYEMIMKLAGRSNLR